MRRQVIVSSYPNPAYDRELSGWRRVTVPVPNHASGSRVKRTMSEILWLNY